MCFTEDLLTAAPDEHNDAFWDRAATDQGFSSGNIRCSDIAESISSRKCGIGKCVIFSHTGHISGRRQTKSRLSAFSARNLASIVSHPVAALSRQFRV